MKRSEQIIDRIGGLDLWMTVAATAIATLLIIATTQAHAQTFTVLHTFSGSDGAYPFGTLTMDRDGNLYGTTYNGGSGCNGIGCGTVFKLTHKNSGWILTPLYNFQGGDDGEFPTGGVTIGPDGDLYGTTNVGGGGPCAPPRVVWAAVRSSNWSLQRQPAMQRSALGRNMCSIDSLAAAMALIRATATWPLTRPAIFTVRQKETKTKTRQPFSRWGTPVTAG
ncbi:MAG: choice-of-anchor tandem repeat GloVer-containing protein [Candidatus Korobacteraceae bacterium]